MNLTRSPLGLVFLIVGLLSIGIASILDLLFRSRIKRAGYRWLFEGGSFNYSRYHVEAKRQGWPLWPFYLMWTLIAVGILLVVVWFVAFSGPSLPRAK